VHWITASCVYSITRYKADFLENTIKHGVVRFGRPSEFNDPWDCKPSFYVPEEECELRRLVDFMQRASERQTPYVDPGYRKARAEQCLANPDQLRRDIADISAEMWAQMDRRYRLYCLSAKADCPLMWGHYADHHRGVCLEFSVRTPEFCQAIQVDYSAVYPSQKAVQGNMMFILIYFWRSLGDSNPCFRRERARATANIRHVILRID